MQGGNWGRLVEILGGLEGKAAIREIPSLQYCTVHEATMFHHKYPYINVPLRVYSVVL